MRYEPFIANSKALSELSSIDRVYIVAGSTKIGGPLDEPLSDFRHKVDERVWGSLNVVRAAHHLLRPGGSFTLSGGLAADRPIKGARVSGFAIMAVEQLASVLALELAPIRFNAIALGYTDSPIFGTGSFPGTDHKHSATL